MSNTILLKRSDVANSVPSAGNLVPGELALNFADGNLFFKDAANTVVLLSSTKLITVTGNITGGNINTAGQVVATGNVSGGNLITSGQTVTVGVTSTGNIRSTGAINSFGDLVGNATFAAASSRSLNLVGTDAVMRVARASPNQFSPAVELLDLNASTGATLSYWDFFAAGSTDSFTLRRRTGGANDFVLTANSAGVQFPTGAVTITGNMSGGNITTAGQVVATGNVSGSFLLGNGSQLSGINTFSTVSVSGQSNVVADSIADTLTFAAGSGIAIVTDAATDTITISTVGAGDAIFADGGDMGTVVEAVTASTDLGLIIDSIIESYDLGTIVVGGLIYPNQFVLPSFTVSELGNTTAFPAGQMVFCTDDAGGAVPAFSDGTDWRRVTDRQIVS